MSYLARFFEFVFRALHMQRDRPVDEHETQLYVVGNRPVVRRK